MDIETKTFTEKFRRDKFNLKPKDVTKAEQELEELREEWSRDLNSRREDERASAKVVVGRINHQLTIIQSFGLNGVVSKMHGLYNRTQTLAQSGLDDRGVAKQLNMEFPTITEDFQHLLNSIRPWGYNVFNAMIADKNTWKSQ